MRDTQTRSRPAIFTAAPPRLARLSCARAAFFSARLPLVPATRLSAPSRRTIGGAVRVAATTSGGQGSAGSVAVGSFRAGQKRAEVRLPALLLTLTSAEVLRGGAQGSAEAVDAAVAGGATMVVVGEEGAGGAGMELFEAACAVKEVVRGRVPLLVAERADIAAAAGADGVLLSDNGAMRARGGGAMSVGGGRGDFNGFFYVALYMECDCRELGRSTHTPHGLCLTCFTHAHMPHPCSHAAPMLTCRTHSHMLHPFSRAAPILTCCTHSHVLHPSSHMLHPCSITALASLGHSPSSAPIALPSSETRCLCGIPPHLSPSLHPPSSHAYLCHSPPLPSASPLLSVLAPLCPLAPRLAPCVRPSPRPTSSGGAAHDGECGVGPAAATRGAPSGVRGRRSHATTADGADLILLAPSAAVPVVGATSSAASADAAAVAQVRARQVSIPVLVQRGEGSAWAGGEGVQWVRGVMGSGAAGVAVSLFSLLQAEAAEPAEAAEGAEGAGAGEVGGVGGGGESRAMRAAVGRVVGAMADARWVTKGMGEGAGGESETESEGENEEEGEEVGMGVGGTAGEEGSGRGDEEEGREEVEQVLSGVGGPPGPAAASAVAGEDVRVQGAGEGEEVKEEEVEEEGEGREGRAGRASSTRQVITGERAAGGRVLKVGVVPTTNEITLLRHLDSSPASSCAHVPPRPPPVQRCRRAAAGSQRGAVAGRAAARAVAGRMAVEEQRHPDGHMIRFLPADLLKQPLMCRLFNPLPSVHLSFPWARQCEQMNVVDTPGTNVILERQQRLTEEFVPQADLVLFVLSADRPSPNQRSALLPSLLSCSLTLVHPPMHPATLLGPHNIPPSVSLPLCLTSLAASPLLHTRCHSCGTSG
ncbi:unnamed protein product, partial [Closterium sp. Yama58-4]